MKKESNKGIGAGAVIGASVAIAAASAAGYLLFGPDAKKNRKVVKGWAVKMKGEIIEKFEEAKELTEPVYQSIVDDVAKKYSQAKNIDKAELEALVSDIRKHWKVVSRVATKGKSKAKKAVSKTVNKAKTSSKAAVKKVSKK